MAAVYGHRYTITFSSEDETTDVVVELHQDGYTYGEEPALQGADDPLALEYGDEDAGDDPNWLIALSRLTIRVNDKAGRLTALAGIAEKEVIAYVYANDTLVFEGFVVPGQYIYDRHLSSVAEITCVRGESFMRSRLYRSLAGENFTGLVSPLEIIRNCFLLSGNTGYIVTAMYWVPRLTNNLTSTQDPLRVLRIEQGEFVDEENNPIVCWDVLERILDQYQLQLWNDANSWFVGQRVKVNDGTDFEAFIHTDLSTQAQIDYPYAIDIWDADKTTLQGYAISHTRPYKYAGATYNHLGPEEGVLHFGGFEKAGFTDLDILKGETAGANGATDVWIVSDDLGGMALSAPGATVVIEDGPRAGTRATSAKSLAIPAEYAGTSYTLPTDLATVQALFAGFDYVYQETSGYIEGGSDRTLIIRAYVSMQWASPVAQTTEVFFCLRASVNGYWLVQNGSGGYELNDTPSSNTHYNVFKIDYIGTDWVELVLETEALDDAGTPITGPLYIELIAGLEANNAIGQLSTNSRWDDVSFEVLDADGNRENQATQAVAVYNPSNNTYGPESAVLLFGDGPTTGHKRRQQIIDGTGSLVDVTGNWQVGRTFTGDDSGLSHLQFWARERLKQHQYPLLRGDFTLRLHGELIDVMSPVSVIRDRRQLTLAEDVLTGATSIVVIPDETIDPYKYGVIQAKRDIVISGSETARVLHAVLTNEADNEWTLYLADALGSGYVAGDTVVQTIDFTWTRWRYSFRKNEVQVSAVELLAGDEPDVVCNYDVEPGSLQTTTLADLVGVPCADEITPVFEPPTAEAGTLFVSTYDSANTLMEEYSVVRVNPDGSVQTLKSFEPLLTPEITMAIDETDLWMLVVDGLNIWRMRFDGSDPLLIFALSGYDRIGDIDYIPSGTYAGQFVFVARGSGAPGGVNDDIYRIDIDGNETKISTNKFAGKLGVAVRSSTEVICNASYTNAGIVSYGLAGTVYAVENSVQIFNSGIGITYDPDNDQAYVEKGIATSALARTPAGLSGAYTEFTGFGTLSRFHPAWFDRAQQRIWYGGTGIKYRAIGALNTAVSVAPTTGGSGTTGNYGTTKIIAVQG